MIATEKKSPSILIDSSMLDKIAVICPNIGIVYSGMGPDFRVLVAKARKSAQAYWKIYGEYPPTKVLTQEIATVMQEATQRGYAVVIPTLCNLNFTEVFVLLVYHYSSLAGTSIGDQPSIRLILLVHSGLGKQVQLARTW